MKIKKMHIIGIICGLAILGIAFFFFSNLNLFIFLTGIAAGVLFLPFIIDLIIESKKNIEISEMFLEFSRSLAESVKTGTPVSKSIINMKGKSFGLLTPHIDKLANQISIGVPVNKSLETFAYEVDNPVITRAITLIREAEKAGGEIEFILESSAKSIAEIEKLKQERKAAISTLVTQGYIVFFIFIGIMLVMEFKVIPLTTNLGAIGLDFNSLDPQKIANLQNSINNPTPVGGSPFSPFLSLLIVQGFFAGLIIGKMSEGTIKSGLFHSFILMLVTFLISTGSRLIFG